FLYQHFLDSCCTVTAQQFVAGNGTGASIGITRNSIHDIRAASLDSLREESKIYARLITHFPRVDLEAHKDRSRQDSILKFHFRDNLSLRISQLAFQGIVVRGQFSY